MAYYVITVVFVLNIYKFMYITGTVDFSLWLNQAQEGHDDGLDFLPHPTAYIEALQVYPS